MQTHVPETKGKKGSSLGHVLLRVLWDVLTALLAVFLIVTFVFQVYGVDGPSMVDTLHDRERMFVTKFQYFFHAPERFDVVVCHFPGRGQENFVKRVIGLPGDTIWIDEGRLYVNGDAYEEDYAEYPDTYRMAPVTLGENEYYVMGDNRMVSNDSRNPAVGPLEKGDIIGKVQAIIWPLSDVRLIH